MSNEVNCDQDYNPNNETIKYRDIDEYTDMLLRDLQVGPYGKHDHHDDHDDGDAMNTMVLDWIFGYDGASTLVSTSAVALAAIVLASF